MPEWSIPQEEVENLARLNARIKAVLGPSNTPLPELTDEDFIPREEQDLIEEMRHWIRRMLGQGATPLEVENLLVETGFDPILLVELISSVRTVVPSDYSLYGEDSLTAERRARQMRRRVREAHGEINEPVLNLDLGELDSLVTHGRRHRNYQLIRFWLVFLSLLGLVALGVWYISH